jgi:hypothetical protein
MTGRIFLDINLPNPATWFYFSALLAVALFFKFTRFFSVRNLDVLALFLPMPGFLLLIEGTDRGFWGYLWLLGASLFLLARCLLDLALVRKPALGSNLDRAGLAWLAGALYVSLVAVAVRQPDRPPAQGEATLPIDEAKKVGEQLVRSGAPAPVDDDRLRVWVERGLSLACHLSIVVGLVLIGWRHFEDLHAGMSAATFYLLLPYTYLLMPGSPSGLGRWDHPWPMALMVWAVLAFRRPMLAGAFLGVAAGSVFFPVVTFPAWWGFYHRRGAARFTLSFVVSAGVCLAILGALSWAQGDLPRSLQSAWTESDWQPWKLPHRDTEGFWQGMESQRYYRLPVFIAYTALVVGTFFWPSPRDLAHVLALSAAVLIGIQFWYPDRGGVYVLWYLPFLLLLAFRPNLSAVQPSPPGDDWVARLGRRLGRGVLRLVRQPEPAARVP